MASVYDLDVSMTLDDFGWHFANHYSWEFTLETLHGLKNIGVERETEIFEQSLPVLKQYWLKLGYVVKCEGDEFAQWYYDSEYYRNMDVYDKQLRERLKDKPFKFLSYWVEYARKYPHRLFE